MQLYIQHTPAIPGAARAIVPQSGTFVNTYAAIVFSTSVFHRLLITFRGNPQDKNGAFSPIWHQKARMKAKNAEKALRSRM